MKFKQIAPTLLLVASLLASALLAACGDNNPSGATNAPAQPIGNLTPVGLAGTSKFKNNPNPQPIAFNGLGNSRTAEFRLPGGLVKLAMNHTGVARYRVTLADLNGDDVDNTPVFDGYYQGARFLRVPVEGTYHLEVQADGNWSVDVFDMNELNYEPLNQGFFKGKGDAALTVFVPKSGLTTFNMSHTGARDFAVRLPSSVAGQVPGLLTWGIGPSTDTKTVWLDYGAYFIGIFADGDWSIQVS